PLLRRGAAGTIWQFRKLPSVGTKTGECTHHPFRTQNRSDFRHNSCGRALAAAACAQRAVCALLRILDNGGIMQIGVHLPHIGRKATAEAITRAAVQAEELGLADVWVSEHVIVPKDAPYPPSPAFLEPILTLAFAAAATRRVRLGTSVIVLPMHHPVP